MWRSTRVGRGIGYRKVVYLQITVGNEAYHSIFRIVGRKSCRARMREQPSPGNILSSSARPTGNELVVKSLLPLTIPRVPGSLPIGFVEF
jgi:hypothetical protein